MEKLKFGTNLNRDEVYNAIYANYENANNVIVYRHLQDYSGNYDEAYNDYYMFNTKALELKLSDFFMDNLLLDEQKVVEHTYFVKFPISTYIKYEALKVAVYKELHQDAYVTNVDLGTDFVILDNCVILLNFTSQGALVGGTISTNNEDVMLYKKEYEKSKSSSKIFLNEIVPESEINKNVLKQIKIYKKNLNLK